MAGQNGKKYIHHKLSRVDNLVSLALKYGVPVGELKKENKLWNNDHLFLREHLLIPLTAENENALDEGDTIVVYNGTSVVKVSPSSLPSTSSSPSTSQYHNGRTEGAASSSDATSRTTTSSARAVDHDAIVSEAKSNADDFFTKYDSSIARLKGDVAKMEQNAAAGKSLASEIRISVSSVTSSRVSTSSYHVVNEEIEHLNGIVDSNPLVLPPRKGSSSRRGSNSSTSSAGERRNRFLSEEDVNSSPVLMIRSRTNNKHVKTTLDNLEQVNDDIFEL